MTVATIPLPPLAWYPPDDSAGSASAGLQMTITSDASDPQARWAEWLFDKDTNEHIMVTFIVPQNFASGPKLKVHWMANATANDCLWGCVVLCITPGDAASVRADEFDAANELADTAAGTAYYPNSVEITLTNADSMAAGDHCVLCLYRHADDAADTLGVDAIMYDAEFKYTTT